MISLFSSHICSTHVIREPLFQSFKSNICMTHDRDAFVLIIQFINLQNACDQDAFLSIIRIIHLQSTRDGSAFVPIIHIIQLLSTVIKISLYRSLKSRIGSTPVGMPLNRSLTRACARHMWSGCLRSLNRSFSTYSNSQYSPGASTPRLGCLYRSVISKRHQISQYFSGTQERCYWYGPTPTHDKYAYA